MATLGIRTQLTEKKINISNVLKEAKEVIKKTPLAFHIRGDWETTMTALSDFFGKGHPVSISRDGLAENWVNSNIPSLETRYQVKQSPSISSTTTTEVNPNDAFSKVLRAEEEVMKQTPSKELSGFAFSQTSHTL